MRLGIRRLGGINLKIYLSHFLYVDSKIVRQLRRKKVRCNCGVWSVDVEVQIFLKIKNLLIAFLTFDE